MFGLQGHSRKAEHNFCRDNLSAFIDGQLTARELERVNRHLEQCDACRADLQSLQRTVELLRGLPHVKAPRSFQIPVNAPAPVVPLWMRSWTYSAARVASAAAAVFLVIALAGNALILSGGAPVAPGSPLAYATEQGQAQQAPEAQMLKGAPQEDGLAAEGPQPAPPQAAPGVEAYGEPEATEPAVTAAAALNAEPTLTAEEAARATAAPKGMGGGGEPPEATLPGDQVAETTAAAGGRGAAEPSAASATPEATGATLAADEQPPALAAAPSSSEGTERVGAANAQPEAPADAAVPVQPAPGLWQARQRLSGYPWGWWALASGVIFAALLAVTLWMRAKRARWLA